MIILNNDASTGKPIVDAFIRAANIYNNTLYSSVAYNTIAGIESGGYLSKFSGLLLLLGDNPRAAGLNIVNLSRSTRWVNSSLKFDQYGAHRVSGDVSSYGATGFIPSVDFTTNDTHHSVYVRSLNQNDSGDMGCQVSTASRMIMIARNNTNTINDFMYDITNGQINASAGSSGGLFLGSRTNTNHYIQINGVTVNTATISSGGGAMPNIEYYLCGTNNAGSLLSSGSIGHWGLFSWGKGLTQTEATHWNGVATAAMTALGRNV